MNENGGRYRARVEYSLTGGGWRPSEAKMTDVLTGPTAVSFADVPNDIDAVRVTYLNAQTGEELADKGFKKGKISMKVKSLSILCAPLTGPCAGPDRLKKGGQRPVNKYRNTRCFGAFLYGDGIGAAFFALLTG